MKAVVDRIVQYANRYQLTNVETGEVLGTFDFEEVTGTVQQVGTEIDKELFDSIANDLAARVKLTGGELAGTIVTFSDISGTAENVASGDTSATLWGKVKNWFSRLKALAFKNKVAAGDFEAGAIKNADVAADAAIAQSKVNGLMTDYVASISASGRTVTYKNKNGVNMGSIITQDTTYELASPSGNGLMSATDKMKLDGIESGAQKNTVLGVKGGSESAYRTGNVNITKANIGLGNVDNTSDEDKPVSTATQTALNGKANTSGTYPNLTVGKATNADNATNAAKATKATQDADGNVINATYAKLSQVVRVDAAQNLTDTQKQRAQRNVTVVASTQQIYGQMITAGWYEIAKIAQATCGKIIWAQGRGSGYPAEWKIDASIGMPWSSDEINATLSFEGMGVSLSENIPRRARLRRIGSDYYFDIYLEQTNALNAVYCVFDMYSVNQNPVEITPLTNGMFPNRGVVDEPSGSVTLIIDIYKNGINTTGQIYQQGSPVLVGDQSAIFESDGTTVKNATNAKKVNGKNLYFHNGRFAMQLIKWNDKTFTTYVYYNFVSHTSEAITSANGLRTALMELFGDFTKQREEDANPLLVVTGRDAYLNRGLICIPVYVVLKTTSSGDHEIGVSMRIIDLNANANVEKVDDFETFLESSYPIVFIQDHVTKIL